MKFRFVGQTDHARRHADFIARQGRNRGFAKRGFRFFRYFFEGWRLRHRGRFRRGARHQGHRESKQRRNCNLRDNHVEFPQYRRRGAMPQESRLHVPTQGRSVKCGHSREPATPPNLADRRASIQWSLLRNAAGEMAGKGERRSQQNIRINSNPHQRTYFACKTSYNGSVPGEGDLRLAVPAMPATIPPFGRAVSDWSKNSISPETIAFRLRAGCLARR